MRFTHAHAGIALAAAALFASAAQAGAKPPPLVAFEGAIGVDPLTAIGGNPIAEGVNTVRGIAPGGRAWTLRRLEARVGTDGSISAKGKGLLFTSGELIGTRGAVAAVAATLTCGAADATARKFTSPGAALDAAGNFRISGKLSEDGINAAVMPTTCDNPVLLIRSFNTTTGLPGNWFAAGIPSRGDDD